MNRFLLPASMISWLRNAFTHNKLKFVFFSALILTTNAISAGDAQDVKNKAYLGLNLSLNQDQISTSQTSQTSQTHQINQIDQTKQWQ